MPTNMGQSLIRCNSGWGFLKELNIESSEYLGTNISGGGASVTPKEALPHIGSITPNEALPHIGRHTTA